MPGRRHLTPLRTRIRVRVDDLTLDIIARMIPVYGPSASDVVRAAIYDLYAEYALKKRSDEPRGS